MKKASWHQLCTLVFLCIMTLNFISLPSQVYKAAKQDSWLVILINMLLEIFVIFAIVHTLKKSGQKNLYQYLKSIYGGVVARIFMILIFCSLALTLMRTTSEMDAFMSMNIYETNFNWVYFALPMLAVVGYIASKGVRNVGRISEIFYILLVVGVIIVVVGPIKQVDFMYFSPILKDGIKPTLTGMLESASWFGSGIFLFGMFGDFSTEDKAKSKLWKYMLTALALTMLVSVVFYGLFGECANQHIFALSDIGDVVASNNSLFRLQWILISMWIICLNIFAVVCLYSISKIASQFFGIRNNNYALLILLLLVGIWLYIYKQNTNAIFLLDTKAVAWVSVVTDLFVPLLIFFSSLTRRKLYEKVDNS